MASIAKIESTEYSDLGKVIRWFINLRWIAAVGVLTALVIGQFGIRSDLPYPALYSMTGALFLANLAFSAYFYRLKQLTLSRAEMGVFFHVQICSDYLFLFLLVYFTGFLQNPFVYYFVFHIMLTAFIFPRRTVAIYVLAVVLLFIAFTALQFFRIVPHYDLAFSSLPSAPDNAATLIQAAALTTTMVIAAYLITNIKERIEERGQRVELELDRYRSLDRAKSNFILQVTHELRGPLAALKGYHEMILKGITGEISVRTRETLDRASHRTRNLLTMIDEMIDFAFMKSSEEVTYETADLSVRTAIMYNVDLLVPMARQKNIRLLVSPGKDIGIRGNRDLLNIILGNLLTNAIKYSPANTTVTTTAVEEKAEMHLTVKDEGMGIAPEELEKIFEEFYRTRRAREIERDGTGLGLSVVQKAVNILGGRITVYSELDKGTSFHIYLPMPGKDANERKGGDIHG